MQVKLAVIPNMYITCIKDKTISTNFIIVEYHWDKVGTLPIV